MWKTCFSASQNTKNESLLKHKNQVRNRLYWQLGLRVWRIILDITWWEHKRQTFTFISLKLIWILKYFCLHVTGYLNTKDSFPKCMFVVMASGKCELHTYFTFLQRILTSTHKNLIFFCIIYVAMPNIHFSCLDNIKITCKTHK